MLQKSAENGVTDRRRRQRCIKKQLKNLWEFGTAAVGAAAHQGGMQTFAVHFQLPRTETPAAFASLSLSLSLSLNTSSLHRDSLRSRTEIPRLALKTTAAQQSLAAPTPRRQKIFREQCTRSLREQCTAVELILGSKVQCFEICTPEGRGGEKGGRTNFETKHPDVLTQGLIPLL